MLSAFFILTRIVSNPLSNVFQKKLGVHADARVIILVTQLLLMLACLPMLFYYPPAQMGSGFWENMLLCTLLAVGGNTLIVAALRSADLSILGPLNAYKAIVGLFLGAIILGELPSLLGFAGVLLILGGSLFIAGRPPGVESNRTALLELFKNRGVQLRFAALLLSAAEAVFLKRALLTSSPGATFVYWCMLCMPLAAAVAFLGLRRRLATELASVRRDPPSCLWLALTTGLMQFSTLYTFSFLQVGYSLALFQTSALLSVLFGYHLFQEQHLARRLLGAGVMIAGATLIVIFGGKGSL